LVTASRHWCGCYRHGGECRRQHRRAGARFSGVDVNVQLPDPGRFAAETGQIALSVQLWTKHEVVDLRLYACTDASCRPGGKPADREYRLAFTRYSRDTRGVLCTTTNSSCFDTAASWNRARFHSGRTVGFQLLFEPRYDTFQASVNGQDYLGYSGAGGCVSSWYAHHRAQMTSTGSAAGRLLAGPLGLSNLGCNFTVYLRP
jgi:hypothetical protein